MIKTVRCKLIVSAEDRAALSKTLIQFAAACNDILAYSQATGAKHTFRLQAALYKFIKIKYGLSANYSIRACDRVAANKMAHTFRPTSFVTDDKLCRYIPKTESISISSCDGRRKIALSIGDYQRSLLAIGTNGVGCLSFDGRNFYINLRIKLPDVEPGGSTPLGIDLGINRIATASTGKMFSGRKLNRHRERYARIKASLQRKGTKGSKRTLKRLSGRERRFQKDQNHCISKQVVELAKKNDCFIVLENLKGIHQRTKHKGRRMRRQMGRWAFYQLRQFIGYKAAAEGVGLKFVNPAYTSKSCPDCGVLGHRKKHRFSCSSCGFVGDADLVGARNIAALGASANRPEVARCLER
jgi:putative transposase